MYAGYSILSLVLFRIIWGLIGGRHARFSDFMKRPVIVISYFRELRQSRLPKYRGHNPAGGWSVLAMLILILVQAITGLYSNDDIINEGPLVNTITKELSDQLTVVHHFNSNLLYGLIGVHLLVVIIHRLKGDNLIKAMVFGRKADNGADAGNETTPVEGNRLIAALVILLSGGLVYFITRL